MSDLLNSKNFNYTMNINEETLFSLNEKKLSFLKGKELNSQNNSKKIFNNILNYISIAKIISVFSVVILHMNNSFWSFNYNNYKQYWISANRIESIFYFGVPVFILCIGATLLDFNEKYELKKYYYRRFIKIVLPLFSWNIILYFYRVYFLKNFKKKKLSFIIIWNLYYNNKIYSIFGSFHEFIKIYIIIPLIAYVDKSKKLKIYSYCFISLILTQSLIPYLIKLFCDDLIWIYSINLGYIIYIFPGYIIQHYKFSKLYKFIIYILGFIGLLIHMYGTQILTLRYKKIIKLHKGYFNIPCLLYSCSIFLFIKDYSYFVLKIINRKYINKIGTLTIGPFFIHLPMIDTIHKYFKINKYSLVYRLLGGICVCIMSLIITAIMKIIPLINYLVP